MNELSEDQQYLFDKYKEGKNLFITGPGGCGKSFLIRTIVKHAKENGTCVDVCALTGCAAYLLDCNATTLHRWSQLGLANRSFEDNIKHIYFSGRRRSKWRKTELLIIDEVSMLSRYLFDLIDQIGRKVHNNDEPFGGIQVILTGDFYQLSPIGDNIDVRKQQFCFESDNWEDTFDYQYILSDVFRQKDKAFIRMLHQIREGRITTGTIKRLKERITPCKETITKPVVLTPIKDTAFRINRKELQKLDTDSETFTYSTYCNPEAIKPLSKTFIKSETDFILSSSMFEPTITFKIGCQVMCIANLDVENGITNGSTGIIRGFDNGKAVVQFNNGLTMSIGKHGWKSEKNEDFEIKQIPLVLAWAVTIHKSQGATLDSALIDLGSDVFAEGQTYVALSRVKSLDSLYLMKFDYTKIRVNQKVRQFYNTFE